MSSYLREIVTLQIGHYSNFIGSHWLNLQEASFVYDEPSSTDLNHDFLFREGLLPNNQECYIPRLLIIDVKGSLGTLPQLGTLYEDPYLIPSASHALWSNDVQLINQSPEGKNNFQKFLEKEDAKYHVGNRDEDKDICLEDEERSSSEEKEECEQQIFDLSNKVKVWSDFLRPHLHPKTVFLLDDVVHHTGEDEPGGWGFQTGVDVIRKEKTEEEVRDRIRVLAETCGSLQGFHLLCDGHDGMGGVGATIGQHLADEYGSKDLFSFVANPPHCRPRKAAEVNVFFTNIIQSYTELSKFSSVLLPLNLRKEICHPTSDLLRWPYLSYQELCPFESSSIHASFLDTTSVMWRTRRAPLPMSHVAQVLTPLQRKVVGGLLSLPFGLQEEDFLSNFLMEDVCRSDQVTSGIKMTPVGGGGDGEMKRDAEMCAIRGVGKERLESGDHKRMKFENSWHLFDHYLMKKDYNLGRSVRRYVTGVRDPVKTSAPFPQIFTNEVGPLGYLRRETQNTSCLVSSVPAVASMYQGEGIGHSLKKLLNVGSDFFIAKLPRLTTGELDADTWKTAYEDFAALVDSYGVSNTTESDSD